MLASIVLRLAPLVFLLASASCATATPPAPAESHFQLVSDKWMALHLFSYHATRAQSREKLAGRVPLDAADAALFTDDVRATFAPVAEAYAPYIDTSLLHDEKTRAIATALRDGPDAVADTELRAALVAFMPVYETVFWPRHEAANDRVIEGLSSQLSRHEAEMALRLAGYLESSWPEEPIRVDVVPYANWAGAYTSDAPTHIMMSSLDDEMAAHAFEMVFHEASHTSPLGDNIEPAAGDALAEFGVEAPGFWHYLLFFVSGRAASETLGDPAYVPYAYDVGLAARPHSKPFYDGLDAVWESEPTLAGKARAAVKKVTEETGK